MIAQSGYTVWKERETALELQRRDVANVSLVLAVQTSRYFGVFDAALQSVQRMLEDAGAGSPGASREWLSLPGIRDDMMAMIRNVPGDSALLLFDANGDLINTTRPKSTEKVSVLDREYFTHFRDQDDKNIYISVPVKGRVTGRWTIFIARRLSASDGRFLGVLAAAVIVDDLQDIFRSALTDRKEAITLLRTDGVVLARFPDAEKALGTSMPKPSPWYGVVANKGGTYRSPGFFGARPSIVYARLLDGYPLVLDVVVSEQEVFALWQVNTYFSVIGTVIVSLSLVVLFRVIDRQLHRQRELLGFTDGLIDAMPGFFAVVDASGRITRWNANLATLTGIADEEIQGIDASVIARESERETVRTKIRETFAKGSASLEFDVFNRKNGNLRSVLWSGRTILNEGRENILAIGLDVTDAQAAEVKLRQSEERLRVVFDSVNDGIIVHDIETGAFVDVNPRMCQLFGYSRQEFLKLDLGRLSIGVSHYTASEAQPLFMRAAAGEALLFDWECKAKDGHEFWVEVSVRRAVLGGRPILLSTTRDITDRYLAQIALDASQARYRELFDHTLDAITTLDPATGSFTAANLGTVKLFGVKDEAEFCRGKPWTYSPERQPDGRPSDEKSGEMIETALRLGSHFFEWTHKKVDGTEFPADVLLTRVARGDETVIYASVRDISERKRLDEELRQSQERLALATEAAGIGIWDWDIPANKLKWDARMYALYGIREQDFSGAYDAWQAGLHPDDRAKGDAAINAAIDHVRDFNIEFRVAWPGGEIRDIEAKAIVQGPPNSRATRMIGVNWDITERKRASETIRLQADQYATMLATTVDGFWILDLDGKFVDVNESFCRMLGYSREELLKLRISDIEAVESAETSKRHMATIMSVGFDRFESRHRRKDGVIIDVEGSVSFWRIAGRYLCFGRDISDRKRAERQLAFSNAVLAATNDSAPEGMIVADSAGKVLTYNRRFLEMWGIPENLAAAGIDDAIMKAGAEQLKDPEQFVARVVYLYGHPEEAEHAEIEFKDGRIFDRQTTSLFQANGDYIGRIWFFLDITERKNAERQLAYSNAILAATNDSSPQGILVANEAGIILSHNRPFLELWNIPKDLAQIGIDDAVLKACTAQIKDPHQFAARIRYLYQHPDEADHTEIELKDGRVIDWQTTSFRLANGDYIGRIWFFLDITERKRLEAQITRMARHDVLTGLANRGVFVEELQLAIARARRGNENFALLYLDLDHFKDVNDTLGHPVGDQLLTAVAERLRASIRKTDLVSRFGGDEFAIMLSDIADPADAGVFADKLLKSLGEPYLLGSAKVRSGGSAGIAVFGADSPDAETLLSNADVALYRAKSEGRGTYRFFTEAMDQEVHSRVVLAAELRDAIATDQLFLVYQPQVDVDTGLIVGVEALARWRHPTRGLVMPGEFIPAAEKSGLISALGRWVLREACRQMREWLDAKVAPALIGVNISALQLKNPLELEGDIAAALAETALPPQRLELELTESVLMETAREHNEVLLRLRNSGIQIAIDDFGNGFSSLSYLSRFSVDRIKIAQNFVSDLPTMPRNRAIVRAAIRLAHELDLLVVVEGVETAAQFELIRAWRAHQVQGFYFSRPLSVSDMTVLLGVGKIVPAEAGANGLPVPV